MVGICKKHGKTEFGQRKNREKGRCKKCQVDAVKKRRKMVKVKSVEYKGGKCICCDYDKHVGALDFHHLNPVEKDFGIGSKGYTRSWDKVKEELDKCVLVCANCHREIHDGIIDIEDFI